VTYRLLSAIIFSFILLIQLLLFSSYKPPIETTYLPRKEGDKGLFGRSVTSVNYKEGDEVKRNRIVYMGATVVVGLLITFSIPNKSLSNRDKGDE
jgi:hypothetical protein